MLPNDVGKIGIRSDIYNAILAHAYEHGVDPVVVMGIAWVESGMFPGAVGDGGTSFGLMQVNINGAGHGHDEEYLQSLDGSLAVGCSFIEWLKRSIEDSDGVISAYNQGLAGYLRRGIDGNRRYVDMVTGRIALLRDRGFARLSLSDNYIRTITDI